MSSALLLLSLGGGGTWCELMNRLPSIGLLTSGSRISGNGVDVRLAGPAGSMDSTGGVFTGVGLGLFFLLGGSGSCFASSGGLLSGRLAGETSPPWLIEVGLIKGEVCRHQNEKEEQLVLITSSSWSLETTAAHHPRPEG